MSIRRAAIVAVVLLLVSLALGIALWLPSRTAATDPPQSAATVRVRREKFVQSLFVSGELAGVMAVSAEYFSLGSYQLLDGVFFDRRDEATYGQVCVLGATAKQGLFGFDSSLGKTLKINNVWFSVVGVIAELAMGQSEFEGVKLQNTNNDIYIPLAAALKKLELKPLESELDEIILEVAHEKKIQSTAVGVLFGSYPAIQASQLNPIDALRYE